MADLRECFSSLGFENVKTVLASGNVIFDAVEADGRGLSREIEAGLRKTAGYEVGVIVRSGEEIERMVEEDPFRGITITPGTRLYVTFLKEKLASTPSLPPGPAAFRVLRVTDGEVFSVLTLSERGRTIDAMGVIEKAFGRDVTTRNWNTVVKIAGS